MLKWLRPLENLLGWLPVGAQYYVLAKSDRKDCFARFVSGL